MAAFFLFDAFHLFLNYVGYIHVSRWSYRPYHVEALLNTIKLLYSAVNVYCYRFIVSKLDEDFQVFKSCNRAPEFCAEDHTTETQLT